MTVCGEIGAGAECGEVEAVDTSLNVTSSHSLNYNSITSDGAVLSKAVRSV